MKTVYVNNVTESLMTADPMILFNASVIILSMVIAWAIAK